MSRGSRLLLALCATLLPTLLMRGTSRAANEPRALILEPFAGELEPGMNPGDAEAAALRTAGFQVTIVSNAEVTVPVMETLPDYSVISITTHAGVLPNGDAVLLTGERDNHPYNDFYKDHTLVQGYVAGEGLLYNGVTGAFFLQHMRPFGNSSILLVNGCAALAAPTFWSDLHAQNLGALLSWDKDVSSTADTEVRDHVLTVLGETTTVAQAVEQSGYPDFGFRGDGNDTLAKAAIAAPPTPTPAPTVTSTPLPVSTASSTATALTSQRRTSCKPGKHRVHGRCVKRKKK
jgi:hypothetical protein